jgi:NAD(P)-dependent dehydrogenase (short-subunit alcohol dehydrogenase family)
MQAVERKHQCTKLIIMTKSDGPMTTPASLTSAFDMSGRVVVITGGAGLLGVKHAETVAELGGVPVLVDIAGHAAVARAKEIADRFGVRSIGVACDITSEQEVAALGAKVLMELGRVDVLINNAANNPKVEAGLSTESFSRMESFPMAAWERDIAVGLTGAFLCSRTFGAEMAARGKGTILNVASVYGLIAPDQRLYRIEGRTDAEQPMKPASYSVVKAGLIGLTRYLATYWPGLVRANTLAPGGIFDGQPDNFLQRYANAVPMGRMAQADEMKGAVAYLISDASAFTNGATLTVDGGHSVW